MQKDLLLIERDYFRQPFTREEIIKILADHPVSSMFNFRSPELAKMGIKGQELDPGEMIDLMLKEPRLIRRPIVVFKGKTYFGANSRVLQQEAGL